MSNGNPAPDPLNSRYFRPVRRKETGARRWDLQFESTSLQQRVRCELRNRLHSGDRQPVSTNVKNNDPDLIEPIQLP
jgi:hypothetical protein